MELRIIYQHSPHCDDMADGTEENEEVEHGVHVSSLVDAVEHCTGDIAHALSHNPCKRTGWQGLCQRLQCHKNGETHQDEANGFEMTV